jgi:hypothetical protein
MGLSAKEEIIDGIRNFPLPPTTTHIKVLQDVFRVHGRRDSPYFCGGLVCNENIYIFFISSFVSIGVCCQSIIHCFSFACHPFFLAWQ